MVRNKYTISNVGHLALFDGSAINRNLKELPANTALVILGVAEDLLFVRTGIYEINSSSKTKTSEILTLKLNAVDVENIPFEDLPKYLREKDSSIRYFLSRGLGQK